ncbi:MAG: SLBB domain-containing protein, partial [Candidatus Eiseniibacteriota bacterium]
GAQSLRQQLLAQRGLVEEERLLQEGPVNPKDYVLGPGDVLEIVVWGKVSLKHRLEIDAEGKIFIPDCGTLLLAGESLSRARDMIDSMIRSALREGSIETRLVSLREFKVHVSGEVDLPGSYTASAVTRVFEILVSGGRDTLKPSLRETSSLRNIEVRRRNGDTERVDLSLFYVAGDLSQNPLLRDGDVIYVPKALRFFAVSGAVMFPGTYELVEEEKLSEVFRLVGGLTPNALLEKGEVRRFEGTEKSESIFFDVGSVLRGEADLDVRDGDRIYVRTPAHYLELYQVLVGGEVTFPGWYAINPREDKLSDVITRAGGFTPEADLSAGRVLRPLSLAGGGAGRVELDMVKLFTDGDSRQDIALEPGDIIEIPKRVEYVRVEGEVRRPGYVRYVPGKKASFFLRQAGGTTRKAARSKTVVKRFSTGQSLSPREAGRILANDTIFVPAKVEGASWALVKDVIAVAAQIATIYLIVDQALSE